MEKHRIKVSVYKFTVQYLAIEQSQNANNFGEKYHSNEYFFSKDCVLSDLWKEEMLPHFLNVLLLILLLFILPHFLFYCQVEIQQNEYSQAGD